MKIKVYVIDFEIPSRIKRWALRIGIPVVVLVGGGIAFAGLPGGYADGQPLTKEELDSNFNYLQNEITSLSMQTSVPPGTVVAYAGPVPPSGWLLCDGHPVSRTTYTNLFMAIGTASGSGDGATTFNLPDYRGQFLRGVDNGAGRDPDATSRGAAAAGGNVGDAVGSVESQAFASHTHIISDPGHAHGASLGGYDVEVSSTNDGNCISGLQSGGAFVPLVCETNGTHSATTGITNQNSGGSETRPTNAGVVYLIKT